jgi:hypothetical protein
VVTVSDLSEAVFRAGFAFARRLADSRFRQFLKANGWQSGQHIVITVDDEPVIDVINKVSVHTTDGRAHIAIADASDPMGFRLLIVERSRKPRKRDRIFFHRRPERITLAPSASIGMLYSLLEPIGEIVPSEWNTPLVFEKAHA